MSGTETLELEVEVKRRRPRALCVELPDGREVAVPLSEVDEAASDVADAMDCGKLVVSAEWARREGVA